MEEVNRTAAEIAHREFNTTPVDVANAISSGNLTRGQVSDDLLRAIEAEGISTDDDPDDSAGWTWRDGEAFPE